MTFRTVTKAYGALLSARCAFRPYGRARGFSRLLCGAARSPGRRPARTGTTVGTYVLRHTFAFRAAPCGVDRAAHRGGPGGGLVRRRARRGPVRDGRRWPTWPLWRRVAVVVPAVAAPALRFRPVGSTLLILTAPPLRPLGISRALLTSWTPSPLVGEGRTDAVSPGRSARLPVEPVNGTGRRGAADRGPSSRGSARGGSGARRPRRHGNTRRGQDQGGSRAGGRVA